MADTEAGVQVVDLSDPAVPVAAGRYETPRPATTSPHDRQVLILRRR